MANRPTMDLDPIREERRLPPPTQVKTGAQTVPEPSGGPLLVPGGSTGDTGPGFPPAAPTPMPAAGLTEEPPISPSLPNTPVIEPLNPGNIGGLMPEAAPVGGLAGALARAIPQLGGSSFGRPGRSMASRYSFRAPFAPQRFGSGTATSAGIGMSALPGGSMSQEEILAELLKRLQGGGY